MKFQFISLVLIMLSTFTFAQEGQAVLILKDSTEVNGYARISGISSIVAVNFKNDTLKWRTYKSKEIIGVNILENNYYRKFRYKYIDGDKFPEIVEIVAIDSLSLYVRIYEGGVLSNTFSTEPVTEIGNEPAQTVVLDNGQTITLNQRPRNSFLLVNIPRYSYYVGLGESDQIEHLYTKGLPFAKRFKKAMKNYFKDCPTLIEKVEDKVFTNDKLWEVLEYYNQNCFDSNRE